MPSQVEGELLVQPFYERGPVLIEEGHEADRALLRLSAGEGQRAGANELAPQNRAASPRRADTSAASARRSADTHRAAVPDTRARSDRRRSKSSGKSCPAPRDAAGRSG